MSSGRGTVMEKKETINSSKRKLGVVLLVVFALACVAVIAVFRMTHRATPIDESSFPDEALRSYVLDKVDTNGDGQLSVEEAAKLTSMSISGVRDLSGLDSFPNLRTVQDSDEILESVDLRGCSALQVANFSGATNLESLKLGRNSGLKNLYIRNTSIPSVNLASARIPIHRSTMRRRVRRSLSINTRRRRSVLTGARHPSR